MQPAQIINTITEYGTLGFLTISVIALCMVIKSLWYIHLKSDKEHKEDWIKIVKEHDEAMERIIEKYESWSSKHQDIFNEIIIQLKEITLTLKSLNGKK